MAEWSERNTHRACAQGNHLYNSSRDLEIWEDKDVKGIKSWDLIADWWLDRGCSFWGFDHCCFAGRCDDGRVCRLNQWISLKLSGSDRVSILHSSHKTTKLVHTSRLAAYFKTPRRTGLLRTLAARLDFENFWKIRQVQRRSMWKTRSLEEVVQAILTYR